MQMKPARLSNIELLRIIAMFGVLICHSDFGALQVPSQSELNASPIYCVSRILIESFALVSVNVFVLISGWFGISFRGRSLGNLLFQTFFFFFGIYAVLVLLGEQEFNANGIYRCLMLSENAWFIKAYLGMYILAPAINEMIKHLTAKQIKAIIITFFVFQTIYGWISDGAGYINKGYSAFSFIGLYMLARYVRVYRPRIFTKTAKFDIFIYTICSLLTAAVIILLVWRDSFLWYRFMDYTSPLTIVASVFLLLAVSKWSFQSKFVNSIAVSCFAVYLMHFMIFPTYMRPTIQWIAGHYNGISMFAFISLLLLSFFVVAISVDRVRLLIWKRLISPLFHD